MSKNDWLTPDGLDHYHKGILDILDKNLNGDFVENNEFIFRATDGITSIKTGTAYLERIKGNTVKWNQLLRANKLVDMGLPSGTLWATCDIDVTKADKFCETPFTYEKSFFSWGNIDGHNPISNSAFDYNFGGINAQEPWYEGQPYGETQGNTLTSNIPANATYDVARSHLGASWRMPTSAEFAELFANIKYINADGTEVDTAKADKRVTVNGVMGLYIESRINGARLFFSCSGYGYDRSWVNRGSYGRYWSSTWSSARYARSMDFYSSGVYPQSNNNRYFGIALRPVTNSAIVTDENGHKYAVSGKYIIDLTLMYGEGNEPSTIAQFESDYYKWFGKPLTSEGYTEGELRDVKMSGIKTIGFNAFDGQITKNAYYSKNSPTPAQTPNYDCTTNLIKVIGGASYYVSFTGYPLGYVYYRYYDSAGNALIRSEIGATVVNNQQINVPDNATHVAFNSGFQVHFPDTFSLCVHLVHSGKRNGEYEPHWEETKNVPITTLTGKLNGEGESVIVFPDGMKSAGEVHDDILIENGGTNGIKRIGSNDLGNYNYTKQGNLYTTDFVPANANMISGRGKAVAWNQLIQNGDFSNGTANWLFDHITGVVNNGVLELTTRNIVWGHPTSQINYGSTNHYFALILDVWGDNTLAINPFIDKTKGNWSYAVSKIFVSSQKKRVVRFFQNANLGLNYIQFLVRKSNNDAPDAGLKVYMDNVQLFDLTLMFGEGNEPTTIEEFERMFPEEYYVHDTGSLGIVADATYPDAASFKAAMDGVPLHYELATPQVYELDNFQLPLPYRVDDYGTEEVLGAENSVAPTLDIRYGINIIDTIRNLPKTIESIEEEISDANDSIDDAFDAIDAKEDKLAFSHSVSAVPPSTALTFTPNVNTIYYQHEAFPVSGNPNIVLPVPETERATIKVIYRNSTSDAPTITSAEGVNVIIESNIGGPYRLTTINCEWYHDCWVVDIQTHGT